MRLEQTTQGVVDESRRVASRQRGEWLEWVEQLPSGLRFNWSSFPLHRFIAVDPVPHVQTPEPETGASSPLPPGEAIAETGPSGAPVQEEEPPVFFLMSETNSPPETSESFIYEVVHDGLLNSGTPGLLSGAYDPDGDAITVQVTSDPTHAAEFTVNADGSFIYRPEENFAGTDAFEFVLSDGMDTSGTLTATIHVINHAPEPTQSFGYGVITNTQLRLSAPGLLNGFQDQDGDEYTISLETQAENGTATVGADGSLTYEPDEDFVGQDSFFISASDGIQSSGPVEVGLLVSPAQMFARIDANNDGLVDETDDTAPEVPGKIVLATVPAEPEAGFEAHYDLAEIQFGYEAPTYADGMPSLVWRFTLQGGDARIWADSARTQEIGLGSAVPAGIPGGTSTVYLEATGEGIVELEIALQDEFLQGKKAAKKTVKAKGVKNTVVFEDIDIKTTYVVPTEGLTGTQLEKAAQVKQLVRTQFGVDAWGPELANTGLVNSELPYKGWWDSKNHDAGSIESAAGYSGFILAWDIRPQDGDWTNGIDFTNSKIKFMAYYVVFEEVGNQELVVGDVRLENTPSSAAMHEAWHTDGVTAYQAVMDKPEGENYRFKEYGEPFPANTPYTWYWKRPGFRGMALAQKLKIQAALRRVSEETLQTQTAQEIAWGIALSQMLGVNVPNETELAPSMKIQDAGHWHFAYVAPAYFYPQGG